MPSDTKIEVRPAGDGPGRQVSDRKPVSQSLSDRREDIEDAIRQAVEIASRACEGVPRGEWGVAGIEMTFGLKLTTESGIIVARASIEAALEIKVSIDRG